MSSDNGKLRVDASELTLEDYATIEEELGFDFSTTSGFRATAALVWILRRRDDPTFTYQQALKLKLSELEIVGGGDAGPEALGGDRGGPPRASPEIGPSTRST